MNQARYDNFTAAILQRIGWYRDLSQPRSNPQEEAERLAAIADLDAYVADEGWDADALKAQAALPEPDGAAVDAMVLAHPGMAED